MAGSPRLFERFWVLQIVGWSVFGSGIFIEILAMPRMHHPGVAAYETVFLVCSFLASFVPRIVCRASLSQGLGWPGTMLRAALVSIVCSVPCALLAGWACDVARGPDVGPPMDIAGPWDGMLQSTIVLISWSGIYLGIKHYQLFEAEHERAGQAEALARSARLQALCFQLQPHFLFNTLNAISTLIVEGQSSAANRMLGQLAGFLRTTLDESGAVEVPLAREVAQTRAYLAIEQARLGDRLELAVSIAGDVEDALVPVLLLQPLAENAIRHGIAPRPGGGRLTIDAVRDGTRVRISVSDNGSGRASRSSRASRGDRRGLGLANTLERLRVVHGHNHRLAVRWPEEGGCVVEIELPYSTHASLSSSAKEAACAS